MTEQFCQLLWIRNFSLIFSWPNAIHIALSHAGRCPGQRWVMLTFVQDSAESSWVLSRTQLSQAEFGQDTAELWTGQRWVKLSFVKDSAKLSWVLSGTALSQAESTRRCGLPTVKASFRRDYEQLDYCCYSTVKNTCLVHWMVWKGGKEFTWQLNLDKRKESYRLYRQFSCAKENVQLNFFIVPLYNSDYFLMFHI